MFMKLKKKKENSNLKKKIEQLGGRVGVREGVVSGYHPHYTTLDWGAGDTGWW